MTAGYSGTPLPRKLGIKEGTHVTLLNAPEDFDDTLGELPDRVIVKHRPSGVSDVIVLFEKQFSHFKDSFGRAAALMPESGGMLWVAWPKRASKVDTDLDENLIRDFGLAAGLVDTKVCAIDSVWSGLRFSKRRPLRQSLVSSWPIQDLKHTKPIEQRIESAFLPNMTTIGQQVQLEVYGSAIAGKRIDLPFSFDEWESRAREKLSDEAYWYVAGAAGGGNTMRANREAFDRVRIRQRTLNDVSVRDISVEVLGQRIAAPFLLAPIGVQGILHKDGESLTARAAAAAGIPIILSSVSSVTMEEVAKESGSAPRWFQLYPSHVKDLTASFVARAEAAGYSAIVVTVDTPALGWREQDLRLGYLPFLHADGVANYFSDPVFRSMLAKPPHEDPAGAVRQFIGVFTHPAFNWTDVAWLRTITKLPILIKGIIHPDDASKAADHGVEGIVVSNHGGRQADGAVGTLDALTDIVDAVGDRMTILLDSGVRHGADVLKALALGAKAVLLGRPYAYALASHGEEGVRHLLKTFMADIDLQLGLCGQTSAAAFDRSLLADK